MNFIEQIKSSVYSPAFYKDLESKKLSYSVGYVFKLSLLLSVLGTIVLTILFMGFKGDMLAKSGVETITQYSEKYLSDNYPSDLVLNFSNGILSSNATSAVSFPIPLDISNFDENSEEMFANAVTIDVTENINRSSFEKFNSYLVLSSTTGAYYDTEKNAVNFFDYEDMSDGEDDNITVTKDDVISKVIYYSEYFESILPYLYVLVLVFMLVFFTIFVFIATLLYTLFSALLAWTLGKIWNKNHTYGVWYRKSLHADTLYILLAWTIGIVFPFGIIPFANTTFVLLVLYFNDNYK